MKKKILFAEMPANFTPSDFSERSICVFGLLPADYWVKCMKNASFFANFCGLGIYTRPMRTCPQCEGVSYAFPNYLYEKGRPVGFPLGKSCDLECTDKTLTDIAATIPESRITCSNLRKLFNIIFLNFALYLK